MCHKSKRKNPVTGVPSGVANEDRTRTKGTTSLCDNHFTIATVLLAIKIIPYFVVGLRRIRRISIYDSSLLGRRLVWNDFNTLA